ncbi:MAG TPA: hypothetical protein VFN74_16530 [Chloroflexota bacterium]|nr:hypothetical protein [Chloroflexota bacterium]
MVKRRPQLAMAPDGTLFAVWDEEAEGTAAQNGLELYYAWRTPGSGAWSAPRAIPATDRGRWPAPQKVSESHARIHVDDAGNLHVAYGAALRPVSGVTQQSAYYVVGRDLTGATPAWTAPARIDPAGSYLAAQDGVRLVVRPDPAGAHDALGYVLWVGGTGNPTSLTRIGYQSATHSLAVVDPVPVVNPQNLSAGPVAALAAGDPALDGDALRLVYAAKNGTSGNYYYGASLALAPDGGTAWQSPAVGLSTNVSDDCAVSGCLGATAALDTQGVLWLAAHWDSGTHTVRLTRHDGLTSPITLDHGALTTRQPVVTIDPATGRLYLLYATCTYASASTCTGRDLWYRSFADGTWSAPVLFGPAAGEQLDATGVAFNGQLHILWVGRNQTGSLTGDQVYYLGVPAEG